MTQGNVIVYQVDKGEFMTANFGCQLDYIWKSPKTQVADMPLRDFFQSDCVIWEDSH